MVRPIQEETEELDELSEEEILEEEERPVKQKEAVVPKKTLVERYIPVKIPIQTVAGIQDTKTGRAYTTEEAILEILKKLDRIERGVIG